MSALQLKHLTLNESIESVADYVLETAREFERLKWLAEDLEPHALLSADAYARFLTGPLRWPGQRERAIAALAIHPDPRARVTLRAWPAPDELAMLKRVALAADPEDL